MKKPNKSIKERKAAIKRGKKRSERLKKTQAEKHIRVENERLKKAKQIKMYKQHLDNLNLDNMMPS